MATLQLHNVFALVLKSDDVVALSLKLVKDEFIH